MEAHINKHQPHIQIGTKGSATLARLRNNIVMFPSLTMDFNVAATIASCLCIVTKSMLNRGSVVHALGEGDIKCLRQGC